MFLMLLFLCLFWCYSSFSVLDTVMCCSRYRCCSVLFCIWCCSTSSCWCPFLVSAETKVADEVPPLLIPAVHSPSYNWCHFSSFNSLPLVPTVNKCSSLSLSERPTVACTVGAGIITTALSLPAFCNVRNLTLYDYWTFCSPVIFKYLTIKMILNI